jgi:hypothetical protein
MQPVNALRWPTISLPVDRITFSGIMRLRFVMITLDDQRWAGRAVECSGLENRRRLIAYPGFESLAHRHFTH